MQAEQRCSDLLVCPAEACASMDTLLTGKGEGIKEILASHLIQTVAHYANLSAQCIILAARKQKENYKEICHVGYGMVNANKI